MISNIIKPFNILVFIVILLFHFYKHLCSQNSKLNTFEKSNIKRYLKHKMSIEKKIKGYGFGVWLLVEDDKVNFNISHPVHITIMCNMDKNDAVKLYTDLLELCGKEYIVYCNNICNKFENTGYSEDEPFTHCSGYYCDIEMFEIIKFYCKKRLKYDSTLGSFSNNPHITYCYSNNPENIEYQNLKSNLYLKCKLVVADIRDSNPVNWKTF